MGGGGVREEPPLSHTAKVEMNAWSSEEAGGYEIFRLGAKPAASFHFKRLSILRCHLRRRRRTLERISDGL